MKVLFKKDRFLEVRERETVIDGDKTLWLIEVKDSRSDAVEKDQSVG